MPFGAITRCVRKRDPNLRPPKCATAFGYEDVPDGINREGTRELTMGVPQPILPTVDPPFPREDNATNALRVAPAPSISSLTKAIE